MPSTGHDAAPAAPATAAAPSTEDTAGPGAANPDTTALAGTTGAITAQPTPPAAHPATPGPTGDLLATTGQEAHALAPDPAAVAAAAEALRAAVGEFGPAALVPAALGRLRVAAHTLADTTRHATAHGYPLDRLVRDALAALLAEVSAYEQLQDANRQPGQPDPDSPPEDTRRTLAAPASRTPPQDDQNQA